MFPKIKRKKTKVVKVGSVLIGGENPIRVQSMTNTDTRDVKATLEQIYKLHSAGCEIIRVTIPDEKAVSALKEITKKALYLLLQIYILLLLLVKKQ